MIGLAGFGLAALAWPVDSVQAADDPPTTAEQTAQLQAEKALLQAKIDLLEKQVSTLNLPKTENKTTINEGGAVLEATQLTADAVLQAGAVIANKVKTPGGKNILLLSADDPFDLTLADELSVEADGYATVLVSIEDAAKTILSSGSRGGAIQTLTLAGGELAVVGAAVKAVAGLLGTEATVSKITLTGVDSTLLVKAVAHGLGDVAIIPSAIIKTGPAGGVLSSKLGHLNENAAKLQSTRAQLVKNGSDDAKTLVGAIDEWEKRYIAFRVRISTPDKSGQTQLGAALRMQAATDNATAVLRVKLDHGAGSLVQYKNAATFFGADPVRVSGGLVASYVLTVPDTGKVTAAGVVVCRTALAKLRDIQRGQYRLEGGASPGRTGSRATCVPTT